MGQIYKYGPHIIINLAVQKGWSQGGCGIGTLGTSVVWGLLPKFYNTVVLNVCMS